MKWKCTTSLLSIPVAVAAVGFGMNAVGQNQSDQVRSANTGSADTTADQSLRATSPDISHQSLKGAGDFTVGEGRPWRITDDSMAAGADCGEMKTQNTEPKEIEFPNTPVCNGAETVETFIARTFDAGELSAICAVKFGIGEVQGTQVPTQIDVLIQQGAANGNAPGDLPLACPPVTVDIPGGSDANGQFFTASFDPTCNPDPNLPVTIALRIEAPVGSGTFVFPAGNSLGETAPTYIASEGCAINTYTPMSGIGFPEAMVVMQVFDGEGDPTPGACCLPKVDGQDPDPACLDDVLAGECADLGGIFHGATTCDQVTCPTQVECPEGDACPDCEGDLDETGVINGADLLILLGCWGPVGSGCECADFNNDGAINGADLLVLLSGWGVCPAADGPGGDVIEENEACGDRDNDGCNADPPAFGQPLACGDTVCGTAWTGVEIADPPAGQLPGTCEGSCGGQSPDGCWCDDLCFANGDCCEDVCDWCEPPDVPECVSGEVNVRDTDWYPFTVKETKQTVTWSVHAEFPATAIIGYAPEGCVEDAVIIASAQGDPKVPFEISACLQPDVEYFLFVAPSVFEGLPCDAEGQWGDAYTAEVVCDDATDCPKGACCLGETCLENTDQFVCETIEGGIYQGDGTDCADDPCLTPEGACCFNDGTCQMAAQDECLNTLEGAYRGNGTTCADMVPVDINCDGNEEMVGICRDCGEGSQVWCNLQDQCDENIDQDPYNGGCNYYDPEAGEFEAAFEEVCCGDLVGGRIWAIDGVGRDLDWRVLNIKEPTAITMTLNHSFGNVGLNGIIFLAQAGCPTSILQSSAGPDGVVLFTLLDPGTYYVIVSSDQVPAGGDNLLCDSPDSVYTLDIACGAQQTEICDANCSGIFLEHPGYPQGVCSCDPLFCAGFSGDDPNQTEFCCPGVCDFCTGGVCEVVCTYLYDTSALNTGIGLNDTAAAIGWMHRFNAGDGDTLTEMRTSYFETAGLADGNDVGWAVYAADASGAPQMPALASGTDTIDGGAIGSEFELDRQVFSLPDVAVSGEFFIAVWTQGAFPAPSNTGGFSPAIADNVWVFGEAAGFAAVDPDNLFATSLPPTILVDANPDLEYVWLLCATGDTE